ncbi:MAG: DNA polymerase III subunit delta [Planctomycetes bacterium]|nr:DNA polymerase III subunit delta [Planctomycetota bacterium]
MAKQKKTSVGEYQAALNKLAAGELPPVCLVCGGQEYFRREAVDFFLKTAKDKQPGLGIATYQGPASQNESSLSPETILEELTSYGLFATQKLVVVRQAQYFLFPQRGAGKSEVATTKETAKTSKGDRLAEYIANPIPGMFLLLECETLDRRTKLGKNLDKHASIVTCPELRYDRETLAWIRQVAKGMGLRIDAAAAEMLFSIHGAEPGILKGELEKLSLFVEDRGEINLRAVEAVMGSTLALNLFELSNAIEARNLKQALTTTRRMLRQGLTDKRGRTLDVMGTFHLAMGSLRSCLDTLWQAQDVAASGGSAQDLAPRLGARAFRANDLLKAGKSYSLQELHTGLSALTTGLAKVHNTGGDPALTLEKVVLTICRGR